MALSKPEDIFPAISGLAKSVQKATGWEYIAGLWKEQLMLDLVWSTHDSKMATRCVPWRAPSFSWASVQSRTSGKKGKLDILWPYEYLGARIARYQR
jgi:hypothetical protein